MSQPSRCATDVAQLLVALPPATSSNIRAIMQQQSFITNNNLNTSGKAPLGRGTNPLSPSHEQYLPGDVRMHLTREQWQQLQQTKQLTITFYPHPTRHAVIDKSVKFDLRIPMSYPAMPPVVRCVSKWFLDTFASSFCINSDDGRPQLPILQVNTGANGFGNQGNFGTDTPVGWLRTYTLATVVHALHRLLSDPHKAIMRVISIPNTLSVNEYPSHSTRQNVSVNNSCVSWGVAETQGRRPQMEDAVIVGNTIDLRVLTNIMPRERLRKISSHNRTSQSTSNSPSQPSNISTSHSTNNEGSTIVLDDATTVRRTAKLFAVFDGHGGDKMSQFLAKHMPTTFSQVLQRCIEKDTFQRRFLSEDDSLWLHAPIHVLGGSSNQRSISLSADFRLACALASALRYTLAKLDCEYIKSLLDFAEHFAAQMGTSATEALGLNRRAGRADKSRRDEASLEEQFSKWPLPLPNNQDCRTASMLDNSGSTACICVLVQPEEQSLPPMSSYDMQSSTTIVPSNAGIMEKNVYCSLYRQPQPLYATDVAVPMDTHLASNKQFAGCAADTYALQYASDTFHSANNMFRSPSVHSPSAMKPGFILLANVGDTRAVMAVRSSPGSDSMSTRNGQSTQETNTLIAIELTHDHKADPIACPSETARIAAAGGAVISNRVSGRLAVARALGDAGLKWGQSTQTMQDLMGGTSRAPSLSSSRNDTKIDIASPPLLVSNEPDIMAVPLTPGSTFLILACDGVWDVMTAAEAVGLVSEQLQTNSSNTSEKGRTSTMSNLSHSSGLSHGQSGASYHSIPTPSSRPSSGTPVNNSTLATQAARTIVDTAYTRGSMDNITAIVILLNSDDQNQSSSSRFTIGEASHVHKTSKLQSDDIPQQFAWRNIDADAVVDLKLPLNPLVYSPFQDSTSKNSVSPSLSASKSSGMTSYNTTDTTNSTTNYCSSNLNNTTQDTQQSNRTREANSRLTQSTSNSISQTQSSSDRHRPVGAAANPVNPFARTARDKYKSKPIQLDMDTMLNESDAPSGQQQQQPSFLNESDAPSGQQKQQQQHPSFLKDSAAPSAQQQQQPSFLNDSAAPSAQQSSYNPSVYKYQTSDSITQNHSRNSLQTVNNTVTDTTVRNTNSYTPELQTPPSESRRRTGDNVRSSGYIKSPLYVQKSTMNGKSRRAERDTGGSMNSNTFRFTPATNTMREVHVQPKRSPSTKYEYNTSISSRSNTSIPSRSTSALARGSNPLQKRTSNISHGRYDSMPTMSMNTHLSGNGTDTLDRFISSSNTTQTAQRTNYKKNETSQSMAHNTTHHDTNRLLGRGGQTDQIERLLQSSRR